jgi:hypothetical protein
MDGQRNDRAFNGLVARLREGLVIGTTGAGLSVWAGYPSWPELIRRLGEAVREATDGVNVDQVIRNNVDPLHCARKLGNYLGSARFGDFIRSAFGPMQQPPHKVIETFVRLPFKHVVTFNFEESAEAAHGRAGMQFQALTCSIRRELADFLRCLGQHPAPRKVVHLHGRSSDEVNRIALTEEGYEALYSREPLFRMLITFLTATQTLLFAGFSFTDNDFCHQLRETARNLRLGDPSHFAIIGLKPEQNDQGSRNFFRDTFSIEPVFYDVEPDSAQPHAGFERLIDRLAEACGTPRPQEARIKVPQPLVPNVEARAIAARSAERLIQKLDPGGPDVQD